MSSNEPEMCINIAACICAKDGLITQAEELSMREIIAQKFPDFGAEGFEQAMNDFFNSNDQIEDYLSLINDDELRRFTLKLAEDSAGADGLDIRENIALEKAHLIWGIRHHV